MVLKTELTSMTGETSQEASISFEDFVSAYRERAVKTAFQLTGGDLAVAEDVAQEAFAKAHASFEGFRGESEMSTWFFRILTRKAANYRRWRGIKRRWESIWFSQADSRVETSIAEPSLREAIGDAIDLLSARQREVFVLVQLEGLPLTEVCQILGCAEGTAKTHLHRAQLKLREQLAEIWRELNES